MSGDILLSEVVNVAMIGIVWTDGQPAIGMEYGPGHAPLCCPLCGECLVMIVEAQREDDTLGWLLFDDAGRCGHILDSSVYIMSVTGTPDAVTVEFVPVPALPAKETGDQTNDSDHSGDPAGSASGGSALRGDHDDGRSGAGAQSGSSRVHRQTS